MAKAKDQPPVTETSLAVQDQTGNLVGATLDAVLMTVKNKKAFSLAVKDTTAMHALTTSILTFVAIDAQFEQGAAKIGKILNAVLHQDQNTQAQVIEQLCKNAGVQPLADAEGKTVVGKKGLQHAVFASQPSLLKKSGKDTLAGKRFSYYLRLGRGGSSRYASRKQLGTGGGSDSAGASENAPGTPPAASQDEKQVTEAGKLWRRLYDCATDQGKEFLMKLTAAAGVKYDTWLPEDVSVSNGN